MWKTFVTIPILIRFYTIFLRQMKTGKVLHIILVALIALFITGHFLLNNKNIQQKAASHVVKIAQSALGTDVSAGSVKFIYPFGIAIDDMTVYDLNDDTLAHAVSVSMRLKPLQLLRKKLSITSIRLNTPSIHLNKDSIGAEPNYAFITSLFEGGGSTPMTFRANSVLVRNGSLSYDIKSANQTDSIFNPNHIGVSGLTANLSLKSISQDSIAFIIRKFTFAEQSGFKLSKAKGAVTVGKDFTHINGLQLSTPGSNFEIDDLMAMAGLNGKIDGIPDFTANLKASVTGSDFKALLPQTAGMTDCIDIDLDCSSQDKSLKLNKLSAHDRSSAINLNGSGTLFTGTSPLIKGCQGLTANVSFGKNLPEWIEDQLSGFGITVPEQCRNLGDGSLKLSMNSLSGKLESDLSLTCQAGEATSHIKGAGGAYQASLEGKDIMLGTIIGNDDLGSCTLTANADITKEGHDYSGTLNSKIGTLQYKGYDYHDIALNGTLSPDKIVSDLSFADRNGKIKVDADIRTKGTPAYELNLNADNVNLAAYHISGKDSMAVSGGIKAKLEGKDLDNLTGKFTLDNLVYTDREGDWKLDNITASLGKMNENNRVISIYGDFLTVSIVGDYNITSIPYSLSRATGDILPTIGKLVSDKLNATSSTRPNKFVLDANIDNTDLLEHVFHLPVSIDESARINLSFNDVDSIYNARIVVPDINIAQEELTEFLMVFNSADGTGRSEISGRYGTREKGFTDINASLLAFEDIVRGNYNWQNDAGDISGKAKTLSQFFRYDKKQGLKSMTLIDSTNIIVNGVPWRIAITDIRTDNGKVTVTGLKARNDNQYLSLDGIISADSTDVLKMSLRNIDLYRTLSLLHINSIQLGGIASGNLSVAGITGSPSFYGSFSVDNFMFLDSYHGHLEATCYWDEVMKRIMLTGHMSERGLSNTTLTGYYIPKDKTIDVSIDAGRTDLHFLNKWTGGVFKELSGRAIGNLRIFGTLPNLDMEGQTIIEDGRFVQSAVNSTFIIKRDTLWFEPGRMLFRNVQFYDEYGHDGVMNCVINHNHFSDWRVNMTANVSDMMVFYQPATDKSSFNARVYANGALQLLYNKQRGLGVSVNARTSPGTRLGFRSNSGTVADYTFLTIVDRGTVKLNEESLNAIIPEKNKKGNYTLDLNIECTEDAIIDMSLSSLTGYLRGNGNISVKLNPTDGPSLNGIYNLSHGQCTLSVEDLIRKNFTLMEGSYVRFNGAPLDTELNIQTYHNVNSVSIYDLDPSASSNNNVRVRCLMDITGYASNPQLSFNIDMPAGTPEEKAILNNAIATEQQRNTQFMYLLAIGRFYTYDVNSGLANGLTPSTMESLVNSTVSGQINNLLAQVFDNDNVSISSNLSASSYLSNDATNLSNKELEGILEARLLNNRLLVNGNFGYRENTINNTSNFIGDFEVKYLLLPRQGISIKGYNKTNDKYFSKATLTTQGVGLVFERDF